MSDELVFTLLYLILCICLIYPPVEFVSAGFTLSHIFHTILGSEDEQFVQYHVKRSVITLLVYSFLPIGYVVILYLTGNADQVMFLISHGTIFWRIFATIGIMLPLIATVQAFCWSKDEFKYHPIALNLSKFCNNNNRDWKEVAKDINTEYRRIDKISIRINPIIKIVATENWILKVTPFTINLCHQSDASLVVKNADIHQISQAGVETQYLNIEVKSSRQNVEPFIIRINASDFHDLEDRIARNITVMPNVKFHRTVIDQFVDVFREIVENNPKYQTEEELDMCIGCMQAPPNVKLQKLCDDNPNDNCMTCYCKPMWCVDCMAKWFASRQESDRQTTWLSSKCTCPMCRSKFCILDVCYVEKINQ